MIKRICLFIGFFLFHFGSIIINAQDIKHADSLISYFQINPELSDHEKLSILYDISRSHTNYDTVLKYSNLLIIKASKIDENNIFKFRGYYYKGLANKLKGNYDKSINAFFRSAEIAKGISCDPCISAAYVAIGDAYSVSYDQKNAIYYYNKAITISEKFGDSTIIATALLNAGSEYLNLIKLDSALLYFNGANKIFHKLNNKIGIAYCKGNIGIILSEKGKYNIAEQNIIKAISILEDYNDPYGLSIYYRYLADIYKKRKEIDPALAFAEISLNTAQHSNLLPQVRDAYEILTELHAINGDLDKAFECQSSYIATRDSINNEETIRKMADLRTEYEVAQKQTEVDLLHKKRENQRIILISLFVVLALTIGIFVVHYSNTRRRKQLHKKLIQRKEELEFQRNELEKLNKTKDRFFSIISHDLRGPINVLNGTTLLIRDFLNSKNYEELDELTSNMEYSVKKVQNLLDNLLEWAVSQQGEFPYNPEILDINDVCDDVLNIFIAMAATKSIILTYEIKPNARQLFADRNSLMTILRNLVSNALKFTNADGAVNIMAEKKNGKYCLTVSDTGLGIPQEKHENLFKIDQNKSTWGTSREKGLGIGLSLVYEFVKMNKGTIEVDSTENVGSSFKICFPQEAPKRDLIQMKEQEIKKTKSK